RVISNVRQTRPGFVRFHYTDACETLSALRAVIAVYSVHSFDIPRPKALLGDQHFRRLTSILRRTAASFRIMPETIGIGAAGSQSSVLQRLLSELTAALDMRLAGDGKGELFLRLARQSDGRGWEVLVRSTPHVLSKRSYRLVDVPGALNATVAYAMTRCGALPDSARVVNLCSGSSTILIEHAHSRTADRLIGVDNNRLMLDAGWRNSMASRVQDRIYHVRADARCAPLPPRSFDRLYADLPFGHHVGSHSDNLRLYPAILLEAQRLAQRHATFVILTHEVKLMKRCLEESAWQISDERVINLRGLHPRLFVLNQNSARIIE
ncbi:MAG: RNA methyltransferase, partial [Chloroflexi bacterium]|nr:RNA methyltransferase [Chloroflexota bacterium]